MKFKSMVLIFVSCLVLTAAFSGGIPDVNKLGLTPPYHEESYSVPGLSPVDNVCVCDISLVSDGVTAVAGYYSRYEESVKNITLYGIKVKVIEKTLRKSATTQVMQFATKAKTRDKCFCDLF